MTDKKKIIIVGAGFAGIHLTKKLNHHLFEITLIDKLNYHQFQPLLYQVATSQIEPSNIAFPLRNVFRDKKHVHIRLAEVTHIDATANKIETTSSSFDYDYLVIATGCKTNYFNMQKIIPYVLPLKSTFDAILIRNHFLKTLEQVISVGEEEKGALLNFVIVGAGATGVELAGTFADIRNHVLPKDYPEIDFSKLKIFLIEGSSHTLNSMSEKSKLDSYRFLSQMGVEIKTEALVVGYDGDTVELGSGVKIRTKTVIWTAGVLSTFPEGLEKVQVGKGQRIMVDRKNLVIGYDNVFALGDVALMKTGHYPEGHPQLANVAITQSDLLAKNLSGLVLGRPLKEYEFKDLGTMAAIGRNKAVVDFKSTHLKGAVAWYVWMFLHLMFILTVKNKLLIFINWAWIYLFKDSSLRLILSKEE